MHDFFKSKLDKCFLTVFLVFFFFDRVFGKKSRRLITWCLAVVAPCCRSWIVIPSNVRNLRVEAESFFFQGNLRGWKPPNATPSAPPPTNKELFKSIQGILRFSMIFLEFLGKEWGEGISFGTICWGAFKCSEITVGGVAKEVFKEIGHVDNKVVTSDVAVCCCLFLPFLFLLNAMHNNLLVYKCYLSEHLSGRVFRTQSLTRARLPRRDA